MSDPRREIPSVDVLLGAEPFEPLLRRHPRSRVVSAVRATLDGVRDRLASGEVGEVPSIGDLAAATREALRLAERRSLRRLINATGIPLHTNLGRAPLAPEAREALWEIAGRYSNLEYDLERGTRGSRHDHCTPLLTELTGAESALVVNNNAAAVLLAVNELAEGSEVIVSRGELVEIGGSFRVPEIVGKSGAVVVEVGTTNRTHPRDYRSAIGPRTGVLLKVHRSNFRQSGFVADVPLSELVRIGREHGVPVVHDLGSGLLLDSEAALGRRGEPDVRRSVREGADLVTFSADKLLGGPQAGIVVGREELVARLRRNPVLRAVRVGKLTLAALEATLMLWRDLEQARTEVPALAMISAGTEDLRGRAERLAGQLRDRAPGARVRVSGDVAEVGGGSCPGMELDSWVIRVEVPGRSETDLEAACRRAEPPVIGRVKEGALQLDPRTVLPEEEEEFVSTVANVIRSPG